MPPISHLGTVVTVYPAHEFELVTAPGLGEFLSDPTPFTMRVDDTLRAEGRIIGVYGDVLTGPDRYRRQVATLLARLPESDWRLDNQSAAAFKVGPSVARPNGRHPAHRPEGTDIAGFPYVVGNGMIGSLILGEPVVNSPILDVPDHRANRPDLYVNIGTYENADARRLLDAFVSTGIAYTLYGDDSEARSIPALLAASGGTFGTGVAIEIGVHADDYEMAMAIRQHVLKILP